MASLLIHSELFGGDKNDRTRNSLSLSLSHYYGNPSYQTASCFVAGGLSSSIRWMLSPLELAKTQMQVNSNSANTSVVRTLSSIYHKEGIVGWFRGFAPTAVAYGLQTSGKYGCYDLFSKQFGASGDKWWAPLASAALAELVADIFMCPFEMCKVQMQTQPNFPRSLGPALWHMVSTRHQTNFPFGSLGPLWARQIPGTMVNFYTFERSIQYIYQDVLEQQFHVKKDQMTTLQQLGVTWVAGYLAGFCAALLSHPADSMISLRTQPAFQHLSMPQIVSQVGWYRLCTQGLAPRIVVTGQIISGQWLLYDTIKQGLGFGTSGGKQEE